MQRRRMLSRRIGASNVTAGNNQASALWSTAGQPNAQAIRPLRPIERPGESSAAPSGRQCSLCTRAGEPKPTGGPHRSRLVEMDPGSARERGSPLGKQRLVSSFSLETRHDRTKAYHHFVASLFWGGPRMSKECSVDSPGQTADFPTVTTFEPGHRTIIELESPSVEALLKSTMVCAPSTSSLTMPKYRPKEP
jgi:hypothetical protein